MNKYSIEIHNSLNSLKRALGLWVLGSLGIFKRALGLWVLGSLGIFKRALGLWVLGSLGILNVAAATFDVQRAAMKDSMTTQPETAILALLQAGLVEGKSAPAIAEVLLWLAQNRSENSMLLYHAGRAAELSGNWKDATSLYQQYLDVADLTSPEADEAVMAVYVLMIERLMDEDAAYNFSRNHGDRLMVCPRARQFDTWFLDMAIRRKDVLAVANRLNACIKAGLPQELLIARYDTYFRELLHLVDTHAKGSYTIHTQTFDAIKDLTKSMTFFDEMKLRLDWAASVLYYVQSRLDGKDTPPPIAEAKALLAKHPQYALWVQNGWAGGRDTDVHPNYVGDYTSYWSHELDAKMDPVVKAAASLDPIRLASLIASWQPDYYSRQRQVPSLGSLPSVSGFLSSLRFVEKNRYISPLTKLWKDYSVEEAQQLAPAIEKNRHPDSSIIRAIATGEKDFGKVMSALRGPELWRLSASDLTSDRLTDQLWHYCGRPGGNEMRDEEKRKSKELGEKHNSVSTTIDSPQNDRLREFKKYWDDYNAVLPEIPDVESKLKEVLRFTPEAVPVLLKSDNLHAQAMLRNVIREGMNGSGDVWEEIKDGRKVNVWLYAPSIEDIARRHTQSNLDVLKERHPKKYVMHPLEVAFRSAVENGVDSGNLDSWKVIAWVNMQCPDENEAQLELARKLRQSKIWDRLSFEARFAVRSWFEKDGMSPPEAAWVDAANAKLVCRALLAVTEESDVATVTGALKAGIAGAQKAPVRFQIEGMDNLAKIPMEVFLDSSVFALVLDVLDGQRYRDMNEFQKLGDRIYGLLKRDMRDPVVIQRIGSYVAHYGARGSRGGKYRELVPLIESLLDTQPESAIILAQNAVTIFEKARSIYGFNPKDSVPTLRALAAKAAMRLGLVTIPVPRSDPTYPIYKAQADWLTGNEDQAWLAVDQTWVELLPVHRKLSIEFLMWVLQRTIYSRDEARQQDLITALQNWAKEDGSDLSLDRKIEIELAYGDIAVQRGMLREAHEIFDRTAKNGAYEGALLRYDAVLRKASLERMAKNYDAALNTLNELALERIPELWSRIKYAMAEVYYDMESFNDASEQIDAILNLDMGHADAKIMQGRLQLRSQNLMEATEVELGTVSSQQTMVPGEKLKVTLSDPSLAVSGAGTEIEVVVWATSGDRETFFLRQFGDQKTKFRGEVQTRLGAPVPGDRVLQVIGDDEVFYAYSEQFRAKMNNLDEKRGGPITVASDGLLMASGRRLLSEAEQRVADMQAQMEEIEKAAAVQSQRAAEVRDRLLTGDDGTDALVLGDVSNLIKPGNPIHVRVIDHDRSRTAAIDEVNVSVSTSSGDSIGRVTLKETGTHTGWFEGLVPTAGAQAMAYGPNSEPGRNPNMVISPNADYPAWRPVPVQGVVPEFTIDLNDSVPLGQMTITANEPGAKLKKFVLQTGMDDRNVSTVAMYPENMLSLENPWHPSVTIMNDTDHHHTRNERSVYDLQEIQAHVDRGWMSQRFAAGVAENVSGPSVAMTSSIPAKVEWKRDGRHHNAHVIYRFKGYFYESRDVTRRFRVNLGKWNPPDVHPSVADPAQYMLVVNGRIISQRQETPPKAGAAVVLDGEIPLRGGLHRFEIWSTGWDCRIGFGRNLQIFANLGADEQQMVACPDAFFNPDRFPEGVLPHRNRPASVTANANGTGFTVKFAPDSRARLLKFLFVDQEGPVPVVNKIALSQPDGKRVLPVVEDFAELNKNNTLEILTGDKISVRYVDDRFVTQSKQTHERFLDVRYSNARLAFEHFEMRKDRGGNDVPYYERLLRFTHGSPVLLSVYDPDMDISPDLDKVEIKITSSSGGERVVIAIEDPDHPGTFRGRIKPVATKAGSEDEIQVAVGGTLTATYRDAENTEPGIPVDRVVSIRHAAFEDPVMRVSHTDVSPFDGQRDSYWNVARPLVPGFARLDLLGEATEEPLGLAGREPRIRAVSTTGTILPRWTMHYKMQALPSAEPIQAVHGKRIHFEIEVPHLALRMGSEIDVYVQTSSGRAAARNRGDVVAEPFSVAVPGTVKLTGRLAALERREDPFQRTPQIPIYAGSDRLDYFGQRTESSPRLFVCDIPLIAGILPETGVMDISAAERRALGISEPHGLVIRPGDKIFAGFRYTDESGKEHWLTGEVQVVTHPVLDVLEEDQRTAKDAAFVGESMHVRVVDLGADVSDDSDTVQVFMQAKSGAKYAVPLLEVGSHSGVFQANVPLTYAGRKTLPEDYDVLREGFPVVYGDMLACLYVDSNKQRTLPVRITIRKGADGMVTPFTKQYDDPEMAMRTQFALAEAHLEMAKSYRRSGEEEIAVREYDQARRLLNSVASEFRDAETRAHAEYLLGNLTQEEADATEPGELQQERYRAALARFMNVTRSYPDAEHASMAQFKIATVYEKLSEPDIAAQEYVKLAYKYPQSEFLAMAMARLGTHFLRKASGYEKQSATLLAAVDDKDAQHEGTAMQKMSVVEYLNAASIFGRLLERFPSHELAGPGGLRAGQAYMRASAMRQALNTFLTVVATESYDGPDVRAQAMYWAGMCYESLKEPMAAYAIYKRLTYDFPESSWAAYARGQLSQDRMLDLDSKLEMERLEAQQ